eukprot:6167139-Amphidinium_carterae.1
MALATFFQDPFEQQTRSLQKTSVVPASAPDPSQRVPKYWGSEVGLKRVSPKYGELVLQKGPAKRG